MKMIKLLLQVLLFSTFCSCTPINNVNGGNDDNDDIIVPNITLKVMSFNVRYSNSTDQGVRNWEQRKKPIVAMIRDISPDVIGTQESRTDQRSFLKSMLPQYTTLEIPKTGTGTGANVTLMYDNRSYNKLDWGYFFLSATPDVPSACWDAGSTAWRATIWVKLEEIVTKKVFYVFNTHYPDKAADNTARLNSSNLNITKMKEIAGEDIPVFFIGDLNCSYDPSDSKRNALVPIYEWMEAARSVPDTDKYYSYNGWGEATSAPTRNLDHIFYRNVTPVSFRTIRTEYEGVKYISDHYPINFTCVF